MCFCFQLVFFFFFWGGGGGRGGVFLGCVGVLFLGVGGFEDLGVLFRFLFFVGFVVLWFWGFGV